MVLLHICLGFCIITLTLLANSGKFSKQCNEILGYKWSSAWRVTGISWKSVPIESMLKFYTVLKYYDLNAIEKSKVVGKASTSFPIAEVLS